MARADGTRTVEHVRSYWVAALAGLIMHFLSGCAALPDRGPAFLHPTTSEVASDRYLVRPPDLIRIHAPLVLELNGVSQTVRADGRISLQLLGEVEVAGLTPVQVAEKLRGLLSRYYIEPEVVVEVAGQNSSYFYIVGEVESPGPRRVSGRDNVLRVIAEARPTFLAWKAKIRLIRPGVRAEDRRIIEIDYDKLVREGDTGPDFLMQEGDIIDVPPTPLAWAGLRVRELLYPVAPVAQAYSVPAGFISTQNIYDNEWGDGNSNYDRNRYRR